MIKWGKTMREMLGRGGKVTDRRETGHKAMGRKETG